MKKQVKKPAKKMLTLRINRKLWGTGGKGGLLKSRVDGLQCCLGFACRQEGFAARTIRGLGMPDSLLNFSERGSRRFRYIKKRFQASELLNKLVEFKNSKSYGELYDNSTLARKAAHLNDSLDYMTDVAREKKLKSLFHKHGIKLIFTGKKAA